MSGAGALVARGRDAELYEYGRDRLLRRYLRHDGVPREVALMTLARAAGYPVPWADALSETEMLLERIHGPTMAEDLALRPWRLWRHARTLASLHRRLHAISAPNDLEAPLGEGRSLLQLDLHPQNVTLGRGGPLVIDRAATRRAWWARHALRIRTCWRSSALACDGSPDSTRGRAPGCPTPAPRPRAGSARVDRRDAR